MASSRKKEKEETSIFSHSREDEERAMDELGSLIIDSLKEGSLSDAEPFESYISKVRSHLYSDPETFTARFSKGYFVLLEELSKGYSQKGH